MKNRPRNAGIKQRQFVSMMPFTASRLGSIEKLSIANPMTCRISKKEIQNCCDKSGMSTFLKKQIRTERKNVKNSGKQNAKTIAHSQAIRSVSSIWASKVLCLSAK